MVFHVKGHGGSLLRLVFFSDFVWQYQTGSDVLVQEAATDAWGRPRQVRGRVVRAHGVRLPLPGV